MRTDTTKKGLESLILRHLTGMDGLVGGIVGVVVEATPAKGVSGWFAWRSATYDREFSVDAEKLTAPTDSPAADSEGPRGRIPSRASFWLGGVAAAFLAGVVMLLAACSAIPRDYAVQEGDILFQPLPHGALVDAIEGVSLSIYSHCGIVERKDGEWYVIEAIGPVRETPLGDWIDRGRSGYFDAYRLSADLQPRVPEILIAARGYLGLPYDIHYSFDDERIYCSELIFKAVKTVTGRQLGKVERLGELNWEPHESYIRSIEGIIPKDREMITPQALSAAKELTLVYTKDSTAKRVGPK